VRNNFLILSFSAGTSEGSAITFVVMFYSPMNWILDRAEPKSPSPEEMQAITISILASWNWTLAMHTWTKPSCYGVLGSESKSVLSFVGWDDIPPNQG
jgi:hypothetical protein